MKRKGILMKKCSLEKKMVQEVKLVAPQSHVGGQGGLSVTPSLLWQDGKQIGVPQKCAGQLA